MILRSTKYNFFIPCFLPLSLFLFGVVFLYLSMSFFVVSFSRIATVGVRSSLLGFTACVFCFVLYFFRACISECLCILDTTEDIPLARRYLLCSFCVCGLFYYLVNLHLFFLLHIRRYQIMCARFGTSEKAGVVRINYKQLSFPFRRGGHIPHAGGPRFLQLQHPALISQHR